MNFLGPTRCQRALRRWLCVLLLCASAAQNVFGAEAATANDTAAPATAGEESTAEAAKPPPSGENDSKQAATSADEFDPSESLSEDVTVAFPVDI